MSTPNKPRTPKTPRQRAEEALAVADRRVTKTRALAKKLRAELESADADARDAQAMRDYTAKNPALKQPATDPGDVNATTAPAGAQS